MIEIVVRDRSWTRALPAARRLVRQGAMAAAEGADVTVVLADDAAVRSLNQRFRGRDAATNVLAFPAPAGGKGHLGDVILAFGVCVGEAGNQGKPLADHLRHLVVHGVLHLIGYDHLADDEADRMEAKETVILASLGVGDPYLIESGRGDHVQHGR